MKIMPEFELMPVEITRKTREFQTDAEEYSCEKKLFFSRDALVKWLLLKVGKGQDFLRYVRLMRRKDQGKW